MKKIHALSLAAVFLLAPIAPVSDNLPIASAVHAAAQQDTIKEYTRPAKTSADKFDTFSWYMGTHGELRFLYPPYALGPYSSGDFTLIIERADAPELFTEAYPLK